MPTLNHAAVLARLDEAVASSWARRLSSLRDVRVVVGCSGGCDSSVLLDVLARVLDPERLIAVYIHHGLSPNADAWGAVVERLARERHVAFRLVRVALDTAAGNVEAQAREARYSALCRVADDERAAVIALAHHRDDQAETVLLQLVRGAGVAGLAAMPEWRTYQKIVLWRPLLEVSRRELECVAEQRGIKWIHDESNRDERYRRNAMRLSVLPMLERTWPGATNAIARTARHLQESLALEREIGRDDLATARVGQGIAVERLARLSSPRRVALLREWFREMNLEAPSHARLIEAQRQLLTSAPDRRVCVDLAQGRLRLSRGIVIFERHKLTDSTCTTIETLQWHGQSQWMLPSWNGAFEFSRGVEGIPESVLQNATLIARPRMGKERFQFGPDRPSRSLKHCYQQNNVPLWEREGAPVLLINDHVLWAPGLGENRAWKFDASTPKIQIRWRAMPKDGPSLHNVI
ncbi:MAG TPA: tRNA lysidine(34) synthetase TilS [Burkholderiaceae bacterium]|nr:tRNA lysidine(34) synthetase TilS [Burkholderiaceae bacterium]